MQIDAPASNVVRLPTAARRKVDNNRWREQRAASREAKRAHPWPGVFLFPGQRRMQLMADELRSIERTPAPVIAEAIYRQLGEDDRVGVRMAVAVGAAIGSEAARQALTVLHAASLTVGEKHDLNRALVRLPAEEGRNG